MSLTNVVYDWKHDVNKYRVQAMIKFIASKIGHLRDPLEYMHKKMLQQAFSKFK